MFMGPRPLSTCICKLTAILFALIGCGRSGGSPLAMLDTVHVAPMTLSLRRQWWCELSFCTMAVLRNRRGLWGSELMSCHGPSKTGELGACLLRHQAFRKPPPCWRLLKGLVHQRTGTQLHRDQKRKRSLGPHVVLLVTELGRFTKEDQLVVRHLQEVFGVGVLAYTILVFTQKEDLDGGSLDNTVTPTSTFHSSLKKESNLQALAEKTAMNHVRDADTQREIANCILLTSPGPHSVLLVVPLGQYTKEEQKAMEKMLSMFGPKARRYMILLFTRKDDLDGMEFHDYLKEASEGIQDLIEQFKDCHCEFNNKATGAEQEAQRTQLLDLVQLIAVMVAAASQLAAAPLVGAVHNNGAFSGWWGRLLI
ncbi:hypothetical protein QTO34_004820 [Cnephaeus nilssonii]|uniref:AIG1-type G domain-containing protein n=1 Tax=Cnephaeus nilssonii TaxID=3371016 RepID=A0AA40LIX8_CNENI|nr:hypothetical protein QTO34_004820 [Eptesicus nilssonii]